MSTDAVTVVHESRTIALEGVEHEKHMGGSVKLISYALGIFLFYFYFGILQEKILKSDYGPQKERFVYFQSLLFILCIANTLFAKLMMTTFLKHGPDSTRQSYYVLASIFYFGAMLASTTALEYVSYPTQVIGKSCKPIPVMILGVLLARKRYVLVKYLFILMIVVGVGLFIYKDSKAAKGSPSVSLGMGELLLLISLTLDGLIGSLQERMKSEHQTKPGHMMYNMNLWSLLFLSFSLLFTGEVFTFITFIKKYPYVLYDILVYSVTSAFGQTLIYRTVTEFGPLPCSIVTTVRKFFTVLGSVIIFGNTLSSRQWMGTVLVFSGLTLDAVYGKGSPQKSQ